MFIDIAEAVAGDPAGANVDFVMLGDGPLLGRARARASRARANVRVPGFVADPWPTLCESLVFVQLMMGEIPASQSLLEAMAAECAVVVVHFDGVEHTVPTDVGVSTPGTVPDFSRAVVALLSQ